MFRSPSEGATAYAELLRRGKRWAPARAAIARGDGAGFLKAVTSAGYGTRYSCAISAFKRLGGSVPAGGSVPGVNADPATDPLRLEDLLPPGTTRDSLKAALEAAGISTAPEYRLTQADADKLARQLNWPPASKLTGSIVLLLFQSLGQPNSFLPGFTEAANDLIGDAIGDLTFTLLVGGTIAAFLLLGAWKTVAGPSVTILKRAAS